MGQTLTNGVYLPDEGERNCYTGLAANWRAVDNHLGDANIHVTYEDKEAWNNHIADTVKHVTAADKEAWNGKADASALTAHTGDTTIHVTAEDKSKWNAVTSKANDADVVHKAGAETIAGPKTFSDNISTKKIISNVAQLQINARSNADSVAIIAGADASEGGGIWLYGKNSVNNSHVAIQVYDTANSTYHAARLNVDGSLTPTVSNNGLGSKSFKWRGLNGINPGALSLPDLSNGIDISGYISVTNGANILSTYTAPADGWISINLGRASGSCGLLISNGTYSLSGRDNTFPDNHRECPGILPVFKNDTVTVLSCLADSVLWAYFYPCMGNL